VPLCKDDAARAAISNDLLPSVFLPSAGGRAEFWRPVAERLGDFDQPLRLAWPGFGDALADPTIDSLDGLYRPCSSFNLRTHLLGSLSAVRYCPSVPTHHPLGGCPGDSARAGIRERAPRATVPARSNFRSAAGSSIAAQTKAQHIFWARNKRRILRAVTGRLEPVVRVNTEVPAPGVLAFAAPPTVADKPATRDCRPASSSHAWA
jgi:hypothetical protein